MNGAIETEAGDGSVSSGLELDSPRPRWGTITETHLLGALMDGTPDRIYFKDLNSRFILANQALARCFGLDNPQDLVGKTDFDFFTDEHARAAYADEQHVITTGQALINKEERETWPDGSVTWSSTTKLPLRDHAGQVVGTCGISRDVTERRRAEDALRQVRDELEACVQRRTEELGRVNEDLRGEIEEHRRTEMKLQEAVEKLSAQNRARLQFVSDLSHQIKTPLASLRFAVTNLRQGLGGPLSEVCQSYLSVMSADIERLVRTAYAVLDLSRMEAQALALHPTRVQAGQLVHQAVESLKMHAEAKRQQLDLELEDGGHMVEWDADRIGMVVTNVVENAIKYTHPGGRVRVTLKHDTDPPGRIVLSVVDNGIGIAPEHIDRVGERHFRGGEQVGGAGLGLSIAREIIQLHGGSIHFRSPPDGLDQGTQVCLCLPVKIPAREATASLDSPSS